MDDVEADPEGHEFVIFELSEDNFLQGYPLPAPSHASKPTAWYLEKPSGAYNRRRCEVDRSVADEVALAFLSGKAWESLVEWQAESENPGRVDLTPDEQAVVRNAAAIFREASTNEYGERDFADSLDAAAKRGYLDDVQATSMEAYLDAATEAVPTGLHAERELLAKCQALFDRPSR